MNYNNLHNNENFKKLCDIVAKNNLICLTGSGISKGLKLKGNKKAPDWKQLLENIKNEIENDSESVNKLSEQERLDLDALLAGNPNGDQLIEAASILSSKNEKIFIKALAESVDLEDDEASNTHRNILDLSPKGIITYNYDVAHENAINEKGISDKWDIIIPKEKDKILGIIRNSMNSQFLFKAHGTLNDDDSMVLTGESYRALFNRYPYYKTFMQQIFTNSQFLIIGFGLSDPDFDMLLQDVFSIFGSPIQEHIVIKHISQKTSRDILFRRRFGLNFLYVDDFKDIPLVLEECVKHTGYLLDRILEECVDTDIKVRARVHAEVRQLSNIGKSCLATNLEKKISKNIELEKKEGYSLNTETSEYVYTYGVIASSTKERRYTEFLIEKVINASKYSEPIAHALVHLRDTLSVGDLGIVEVWMNRFYDFKFLEDKNNPDPDNRVYKYCEAIRCLLEAKKRS